MRSPSLRPPTRLLEIVLVSGIVTGGAACSSQQAYSAGQVWQRNECQKMPDATSRSRCLEAAGMSAEAYRREADAAKAER